MVSVSNRNPEQRVSEWAQQRCVIPGMCLLNCLGKKRTGSEMERLLKIVPSKSQRSRYRRKRARQLGVAKITVFPGEIMSNRMLVQTTATTPPSSSFQLTVM
jgi:hypothetical protein